MIQAKQAIIKRMEEIENKLKKTNLEKFEKESLEQSILILSENFKNINQFPNDIELPQELIIQIQELLNATKEILKTI